MKELEWPDGVFPDIPAPKPGELTVIAAPRVSGKTTFAVALARAWGRELKVVLCAPQIEALPPELRRQLPDLFRVVIGNCSISGLYRRLVSDGKLDGPDVLILDEVWLYPEPVTDPGRKRLTLKRLAQELRIPVIAIVNRSSAVDAVLAADSLLVTDGKVSCATKEPDVGVRWFGGASDAHC